MHQIPEHNQSHILEFMQSHGYTTSFREYLTSIEEDWQANEPYTFYAGRQLNFRHEDKSIAYIEPLFSHSDHMMHLKEVRQEDGWHPDHFSL